MDHKRMEIGDDKNALFELPGTKVEEAKPGLHHSKEDSGKRAEGRHDRARRCENKDIPQTSLAERIRKREKGD